MIILYALLVILLLQVVVMVYRTFAFKANTTSQQPRIELQPLEDADEKLADAIRIPTISNSDYSQTKWQHFSALHKHIETVFPHVHQHMTREIINSYSLVFHWKGKNSNLKPCLTMAHLDVVPVEEGTEEDWTYGAFDGVIADGYIWGRGSLDIKSQVIASLESAERLIKDGYIPERDHYFAFGHDEEVGGSEGASKIVEHFLEKGITFDYIIDEGGTVIEDFISDFKSPIATIGIGEKGYANIKVSVQGTGGHASMPPKHTALGTLSGVIHNLEKSQCPLNLIPSVHEFLMKIGPYMKWPVRFLIANLWLTKPIFIRAFAKSSTAGNAMLRTTTAVTMAEASMEPNVLPQTASLTANFRILPGEKGDDLLHHIKKVNSAYDIKVTPLRLENPSSISSTDSEGFKRIESLIKQLYGDVVVTPYLVLGGTDSRKYEPLCQHIYRFSPYLINKEELGSMHSTNERLSQENFRRCITFFMELYKQQ